MKCIIKCALVALTTALVLCTLCGCQESEEDSGTAAETADKIGRCTGCAEHTVAADADFWELNLGGAPQPLEYAVRYSDVGEGAEYGVFLMQSDNDAMRMLAVVQDYLTKETAAKKDMARLYPGPTATADAEHFAHAVSGRRGRFIFYFAGDAAGREAAKKAFFED